ncbi:sodium/potassium-transporting ATPase subunit beta-1-like [Watersipora subatra]|uniref:sodium/potassium-transporting ATPase subunit beta-1-like n=1 Tax=Watersipora subatra TaxID=2589382 RepID=UPI00355C578B
MNAANDPSFGRREPPARRSPEGWAKLLGFYVVFFGSLALWFFICIQVFYTTLDETSPKFYGDSSLPQANPGMAIRPMPFFDSTLIKFTMGQRASYQMYIDHLHAFFKFYDFLPENSNCELEIVSTMAGCNVNITEHLEDLGALKNDFGYRDGAPVVALKINKLYDFKPEAFESLDEIQGILQPDEILDEDKLAYGPGRIGVSCDGQNAVDRQHIRDLKFSPANGLTTNLFPYLNQKGYRSPVILVKFADITMRVTIQVVCKLWAWNIDNSDGKKMRASVHFELYVNATNAVNG